eukprot:Em0001g2664a
MVGYLNMTDPTQLCPVSWQTFTSPRSMCGKKTTAACDSLKIPTAGASYRTVCGWFRGYQMGSPDAFGLINSAFNLENEYVDGISITYGSPGNRHHVYTYAAGVYELSDWNACPCTEEGGSSSWFVGYDYHCESGNPGPGRESVWYVSDVLWDGKQCGGNESTCCNSHDLPWFCKTFPNPISENLEVRICTDQELSNENVAIESFELYISVQANTALASMDTSTVIGITFAILFVMFSLVVLVAVCVCCLVKRKSKVILRHSATIPSTHNMIETDQKDTITDIERDITMETNCVYAVPADLSDYYI